VAPVLHGAGPAERGALDAIVRDGVPARQRDAVHEPLSIALNAGSVEEHCLVARDRTEGAITGFVLFGHVAGTHHTGRVRAVVVTPFARRRGVGRALMTGALEELRRTGCHLVVAEVPDEPDLVYFAALLNGSGFRLEATVPDLVRDGVAMRYFVWRV